MKVSPLVTGWLLGLVIGVWLGATLMYLFAYQQEPPPSQGGPPGVGVSGMPTPAPKGGMPKMKMAPVFGKKPGDTAPANPEKPTP